MLMREKGPEEGGKEGEIMGGEDEEERIIKSQRKLLRTA
jgi:hypothetical protein